MIFQIFEIFLETSKIYFDIFANKATYMFSTYLPHGLVSTIYSSFGLLIVNVNKENSLYVVLVV